MRMLEQENDKCITGRHAELTLLEGPSCHLDAGQNSHRLGIAIRCASFERFLLHLSSILLFCLKTMFNPLCICISGNVRLHSITSGT